jgi:CRP-like cAMP-binding protein
LPGYRESNTVSKSSDSFQNRLLASLPASEQARLRPSLQQVDLPLGKTLPRSDTPGGHAFFPERGMISLVRPMLDGSMVEVGVIGREGFVGIAAVLGGDISIVEAMVQLPGSALSTPTEALRAQLDSCPVLKKQLQRFAQALLSQVAQTAACNGRHKIRQRLSRWLLMASDCLDGAVVPLRHEFLAVMLGTRRAGVTVALGALKKAGLIGTWRGTIELLNRPALEAVACECYGEMVEEYKRLLP